MTATEQMIEGQRRLCRMMELRDFPEKRPEFIFNFIVSAAPWAVQAQAIMMQMQRMGRYDPLKEQGVKALVYLLGQIEKHYEDSFGVPPSWREL